MSERQKVQCLIRRNLVADTPEERVRQHLLQWMIDSLGYPRGHLAVEQALKDLPHLSSKSSLDIPSRRADVLCYAKGDFFLKPLLLVECKATLLTPAVIRQVAGYNRFVGSSFVAIANATEVRTGWLDAATGQYVFQTGLPRYATLVERLK